MIVSRPYNQWRRNGRRPSMKASTIMGSGDVMKATGQLHRLGQSLWLDNITRDLLT